MARILVSTPILDGCLAALDGHDLAEGAPGSDPRAEGLLCAPTQPVDSAALASMPALRAIAVAGAGTDALDVAAAGRRGIAVLTAGEALVQTTADLAFALILAACRRLHDAESILRDGDWAGWSFEQTFGRDVHGATLGLVGYGAVARAVARRAAGFSMTVIHHARKATGEEGWREHLDDLMAESDVVSVHVPLTGATLGLIDRRRIGLMKRDGVLVNTARGAVVDENALAEALEQGRLLAAGLDVYVGEPHVSPRLLAAPRTVLLPHVGSATEATRRAMLTLAAQKLAAAMDQ